MRIRDCSFLPVIFHAVARQGVVSGALLHMISVGLICQRFKVMGLQVKFNGNDEHKPEF